MNNLRPPRQGKVSSGTRTLVFWPFSRLFKSAKTSRRSLLWKPLSIGSVLLLLTGWIGPFTAQAETKAAPAAFAYGARLESPGEYLDTAVGLAARLGLQWLAVTLDWAGIWADPDAQLDLTQVAPAMELARENGIPVMISVTNTPGWALSSTGPDPDQTIQFVLAAVQRFPAVQAVELFPGANTAQGWGTTPDPGNYLALIEQVQAGITRATGRPLEWIAGGLTPLPASHPATDMEDLTFLEGLYFQGGSDSLTTISLRFADLTGSPLTSPFGTEARVLRRYEAVRQVMLDHGHKNGMLWITSFSWPSGKISPEDRLFGEADAQAYWLYQAYLQLSSQLYIGAAFINGLNPPLGEERAGIEGKSLISKTGGLHPGLWNLSQLITITTDPQKLNGQGLISIKKIHFDKNRFKPFL